MNCSICKNTETFIVKLKCGHAHHVVCLLNCLSIDKLKCTKCNMIVRTHLINDHTTIYLYIETQGRLTLALYSSSAIISSLQSKPYKGKLQLGDDTQKHKVYVVFESEITNNMTMIANSVFYSCQSK